MTPTPTPRSDTASAERPDATPAAKPHAVVTGTSSGIGLAIARQLLQGGWRVSGLDIAPHCLSHDCFMPFRLNLLDVSAINSVANEVIQSDPPHALVHAAGVMRVAPLGQLQPDQAHLMWQLHVDAASRLANTLLPAMRAAGRGRVVLIGSRVASGVAGRSEYGATKAALIALARAWAAEVVASGVTVNVVSPAATQTAMLDDPARQTVSPKLPPLGRLIQPDEIAAMVAYLLGPHAAAITGQNIQICGGSSL